MINVDDIVYYARAYEMRGGMPVTICPTYPHELIGSNGCMRCKYWFGGKRSKGVIDCKSFKKHRNSAWNEYSCRDCIYYSTLNNYPMCSKGNIPRVLNDGDMPCDRFVAKERRK